MLPILASWPTAASFVRMSMAGTVSERDSESSISDWQDTEDFACLAPFCTTTLLRNVLIPPLLLIERVFMYELVFLPMCTTFAPVSRFCPAPANVTPVNSILALSPLSTLIGYRQPTWDPNEPETHSITPLSSTSARFVLRLYIFFDQFSMVE